MKLRSALLVMVSLGCGVMGLQACSSDPEINVPDGDDAATTSSSSGGTSSGASSSGGSSSGESSSSGGSSSGAPVDAGPDASCPDEIPEPAAPVMEGGESCNALPFTIEPAPFVPVDESVPNELAGGTLPAGIYDVVQAERASGSAGSWQETFVFDGIGRFTRTRRITASTTAGPISYRSGSYSFDGNSIVLAEDCFVNGTNEADAGSSTVPYEVVNDACGRTLFKYSVTGFRFTLRRR